jgi:hypothetical protein
MRRIRGAAALIVAIAVGAGASSQTALAVPHAPPQPGEEYTDPNHGDWLFYREGMTWADAVGHADYSFYVSAALAAGWTRRQAMARIGEIGVLYHESVEDVQTTCAPDAGGDAITVAGEGLETWSPAAVAPEWHGSGAHRSAWGFDIHGIAGYRTAQELFGFDSFPACPAGYTAQGGIANEVGELFFTWHGQLIPWASGTPKHSPFPVHPAS